MVSLFTLLIMDVFFSVRQVCEGMNSLKQDIRLVRISVLEVKEEVWRNRLILENILKHVEGGSAPLEREEVETLPEEFSPLPIETEHQFENLEELLANNNLKTRLVST